MTIDDLRRCIKDLPGGAKVYITLSDNELDPVIVTWAAKYRVLRLCTHADEVSVGEQVLEDYSPASAQFGAGA